MTHSLREIQKRVGETNGTNGFNKFDSYPEEYQADYIAKKLLLVIGEVSYEAFEEIRSGKHHQERYYGEDGKPEGFPAEIADAIIRLLGVAYELDIDMQDVLDEKMEFNGTREFLHGRKF